MKPKEKKPEIVYRIFDRATEQLQGAYSRAYCTEYDFSSVSEAIYSHHSHMFADKKTYKVCKYCITYELIEDDVDIQPTLDREEQARRNIEALIVKQKEGDNNG